MLCYVLCIIVYRLYVDRNWTNVTHVISIGGCIPFESFVSYATELVYKDRGSECSSLREKIFADR